MSAVSPPWRRLASGFDDVALWLVDLAVAPAAANLGWLSDAERARAARLRDPVHRLRYERAHIALRGLLGAQGGVAPGSLRFELGAAGKPALAPPAQGHFNLSHSADLALVAICPAAEIGVDLEVLHAVPDAAALAARVCSAPERAAWSALAATPEGDTAFLRCWTRKEACLKAVGTGLGVAPDRVETGCGGEPRRLVVPCPEGAVAVDLHSLEPDGAWVAAVARRR